MASAPSILAVGWVGQWFRRPVTHAFAQLRLASRLTLASIAFISGPLIIPSPRLRSAATAASPLAHRYESQLAAAEKQYLLLQRQYDAGLTSNDKARLV